jgi:hypothetical protein
MSGQATKSPPRVAKTAKVAKPVRFESVNDVCTWTNEKHVETLLKELPWMRAAVALLNMNDRELEAKIYGSSDEDQHALCDLVDALLGIRKRYQAGIDICTGASARIMAIFDRLQAEAEVAQ